MPPGIRRVPVEEKDGTYDSISIDDVDGLIHMFRWFGWWETFAAAVRDWREGDGLVAQLMVAGAAKADRV